MKELVKRWIPDYICLKIMYKKIMGKKLNLRNPKTFNEKLQWLKLYNRNPKYITLVDKYEVKNYIENFIGREYVVPTLGIWNHFDEINFDLLPEQFVLKCTHDSGGIIFCEDKNSFDYEQAKKQIEESLARNFFYFGREWPYKFIKPRIIAEPYMKENGHVPIDYKISCFNGNPYKVMVCVDRDKDSPTRFYSYDWKWNLLKHNKWGIEAENSLVCSRPVNLDEMYTIAQKLSNGIPFVRIDLYEIEGKIYFGEMTFYPDSGFDKNIIPEIDELYGDMLILN